MLLTGPIATVRAILDRFGASRIDREHCDRDSDDDPAREEAHV